MRIENSMSVNTQAVQHVRPSRTILSELFGRQRSLAVFGTANLLLAVVTFIAMSIDARTIEGVGVWVKPTKFYGSSGLFALTMAWFFGYVQQQHRSSRTLRVTVQALLFSATFELAWITWQAWQGISSHFNYSTPFYEFMFYTMGFLATILAATSVPLAWAIRRNPEISLPAHYVEAVVAGLLLTFVLSTLSGGVMGFSGSHAVGAEGQRLLILGWNGLGGDYRVSHFLALHAMQILPMFAILVGFTWSRSRNQVMRAATIGYALVVMGTFLQAIAGKPTL
jgi:hypothetical protein